jgi:hypothetical protein
MKVIQKYSKGTPRLINLIADRCLMAGMSAGTMTISGALAKQAVSALEFDRTRMRRTGRSAWMWVSLGLGVALLVMAMLVFAKLP